MGGNPPVKTDADSTPVGLTHRTEKREMNEKFKLTDLEKGWILYDVGNSAFILMVSTLIPIFFNALAESAGASWTSDTDRLL